MRHPLLKNGDRAQQLIASPNLSNRQSPVQPKTRRKAGIEAAEDALESLIETAAAENEGGGNEVVRAKKGSVSGHQIAKIASCAYRYLDFARDHVGNAGAYVL